MSEQVFDCPFCNKEQHFYVNTKKGVYYCFKCGAGGRTSTLEDPLFTATLDDVKQLDQPPKPADQCDLPPTHQSIGEKAYEYLSDRLPYRVFNLAKNSKRIRETEDGLLFLFPHYDYWQERKWKGKPRWRNPHNAPMGPADGVTYLTGNLTGDQEPVVWVEGIFDALVVSHFLPAAAHLSQNIHYRQVLDVIGLTNRTSECIYLPDSDVSITKKIENVGTLSLLYKTVRIGALGYGAKDPAELYQKYGLIPLNKALTGAR